MNEELLKAAKERFPNLSKAEECMLCAVKSIRAICGDNDDDSNPANDPQCGVLWDETRTIRADVIEWLCKNAATYSRSASDGIHVYGAKVVGILDFSYESPHLPLVFIRCAFLDEIWLKNAKILSLNLTGCWTKRILADGLQAANHVWFGNGFHAKGEVLFRDANIGGSFNAVGATFEYDPTDDRANSFNSLGCDRINVNGSMFLRGSSFKGEVGLAGAFIGSNLECDGGTFENPFNIPDRERLAIRADRLTVNGGVFLRYQFSAKGAVRLINASIGTLDCTAASIEGDGKTGFNAEGATIAGYAVFDNFTVLNGGVELRVLTAGDVTFRAAKLTTVDLRFATIRRALRFKQIQDAANSTWVLQNASVGSLDDDEESWPPRGRLFIDGFEYQGFGSPPFDRPGESFQAPPDFRLRKQWIERDTFRPPHAYRQLANVYLKMGDTLKARRARYYLEELLLVNTIQESSGSSRKALHWIWQQLLKWTIGYGYKLWLPGLWLALLLIIGSIFSHAGYFAHAIIPTDKDAYTFFAQHGYPPNGYPPFSISMFTIENSLPAVNFAMSDHWAAHGCLRYWFMCQKIAGWFLSIFFIAGITGLAKSDK
jgi:hypothetical protein